MKKVNKKKQLNNINKTCAKEDNTPPTDFMCRPLHNPNLRLNCIRMSATMPLLNSVTKIEFEATNITVSDAIKIRRDLLTRIA